mmetsp:Transcript_29414/g.47197  ORF Transcript_29414/g.47197 Transcript_29414/m.47197 type:complete len:531 (-) Transcript_29414:110-1702(-)
MMKVFGGIKSSMRSEGHHKDDANTVTSTDEAVIVRPNYVEVEPAGQKDVEEESPPESQCNDAHQPAEQEASQDVDQTQQSEEQELNEELESDLFKSIHEQKHEYDMSTDGMPVIVEDTEKGDDHKKPWVPEKKPVTRMNINLMVVGPSAVGKTSFITSNLVEKNKRKSNPVIRTKRRKTKSIAQWIWADKIDGFELLAGITDTVGFGDEMDLQKVFDPMRSVIKDNMILHYMSGQLDIPSEERYDPRIHVVLYFVEPHSTDENDMSFIKEFSKLTNVMVLVSKADTMTLEEREEQKNEIMNKLAQENVQIYGGRPFFILCQDRTYTFEDPDDDKTTSFHWNIEDKKQSDFPKVRDLLFREVDTVNGMKKNLEHLYGRAVVSGILRPPLLHQWTFIFSLLMAGAIAAIMALFYIATPAPKQFPAPLLLLPGVAGVVLYMVLEALTWCMVDSDPVPNRYTPLNPYRHLIERREAVIARHGTCRIQRPVEWPISRMCRLAIWLLKFPQRLYSGKMQNNVSVPGVRSLEKEKTA